MERTLNPPVDPLTVGTVKAKTSAGLLLENSNGDDVLLLGAGPSQGITAYGQINGTSIDSTSASGVITRAAATQDAIRILGRAGGTSSYIGTITPTTLTASRTYTMPDASVVVSGSSAALTSGRIVVATTGGLLSDDSALVWDSTNDSLGIGTAATSTTQIKTAKTFTATSATYGIDHRPVWAPSATSSAQSHGSQLRFDCNATAGAITAPASTPNSSVMCQAVCAAGDVTAMAGFSCEVYNLGTGTLGTAISVHARTAQNTGGGSLTNAIGLRVESQTAGTNRYGIDVAAIGGGTTNFAIRTSTGLCGFADSGVFGATALLASERLRVAGGTMGTPGATDVLIAAGRVYAGDTGLTSVRASGGVQIGTQLGVGTAASAAIGINVTQTALTGTTQYGHLLSITGTSSATGAIQGFTIAPATAVASFTCGEVQGIRYQNVSIGSGSSVTTQSAIKIDALSGAANNFAINTAGAGLVLISDTTNATGLGAGGAAIVGLGGASFSRSLWVGGTAGDYINIANSTGELRVNATKVVSSRKTGWTAATGTATRTGFATSTATTTQVAEALKALMDDLISHGLIGA